MTEAEFSIAVAERLGEFFLLTPQVWMTHWSYEEIRIDFVGSPRDISIPSGLYGFELKVDPKSFKDTSGAFKQSIDYQQSRVTDKRFDEEPALRHTFLITPCPWSGVPGLYGRWGSPDDWNGGALRLAGKFGVGIATTATHNSILALYVGAEIFWSEAYGARGGVETWHTKNKVGNQG